MKTRKIHSKIWQDDWFYSLSIESKLLFIYLISNQYIGITGTYELAPRVIMFETGLTKKQWDNSIYELSPKVIVYKNWVQVAKAEYYDPIRGENNTLWKTRQKELDMIPQEVIEYFNQCSINPPSMGHSPSIDGRNGNGIGKGIGNGNKGGVGENKPTESQLQEIADTYQVPLSFVLSKWDDIENYCASTGKKYKDYLATLRNWVKRDAMSIRKDQHDRSKIAVVA